jgi:GxxExxY protein
MIENKLAKEIVDAAYQVHTKLGPGLFESVYEVVLAHELEKRGLVVENRKQYQSDIMISYLMKDSVQISLWRMQ